MTSVGTDRIRSSLGKLKRSIQFRGDTKRLKAHEELAFWKATFDREGHLVGRHFEYFFTTHFGLDRSFYDGARMLDIGCGPRGSLEWASGAAERVGLDPLVPVYRELGIDEHEMTYVASGSEDIPFDDGHFDVVSSFNSLDHVDDLHRTIAELKRVLRSGGTLLLLTDVNHDPTPTEPIAFSWDVVAEFGPELRVVDTRHYEKSPDGVYQSIEAGVDYDHSDPTRRYGVLSARLERQV